MGLADRLAALMTLRRLGLAFVLLVVVVGGSVVLAQAPTVTPTPAQVTPTDPQAVTLSVTNAAGEPSVQTIDQAVTVVIGAEEARILSKDTKTGLRIQPPALDVVGRQPVRLLDANKNVLAEGELLYQDAPARPLTFEEMMRVREQDRRDVVAQSNAYYMYVAVMFAALLFPFVLAIYRGTSGSHTTDRKPLGLPVGSFRSILAYSLIAYLGFYVLTSILSVSYFNPPEFLLGVVATVIGFYFGSRSSDEGTGASDKLGAVRGTVRQGANPYRGALVRFKRAADGTVPYTRISDVEGRFELAGLLPGEYLVQASIAGGAPSDEQKVSIAAGSDHEIEISIKETTAKPPAQTGALEVKVVDPAGAAAAKALVVVSQGGADKVRKEADAAGVLKVDRLPTGEYEVEASLAPHKPSGQTKVTVAAGGAQSIALTLKPGT